MKAIKLITILTAAVALTACGTSKKVQPDDPWAEVSYVDVQTYKDGKLEKVKYIGYIGKGTAPTQYFAEMKAESDAQARMAEAFHKDKAKLKGVTRVGETLVRYDKNTRMYTVFVRVGVPAKKN